MDRSRQNSLLLKVGDLGVVSADEARALLDEVSEDGIASRAEAEAILKINRKLDDVFPDWDDRFSELIKAYLLTVEQPVGWIDTDQSEWLANQITPFVDVAKPNEYDLLVSVLPHIDAPSVTFGKCVLAALTSQARRLGRMTPELVAQLRSILLQLSQSSTPWITKWEAQSLLKLNDRIGKARNDDSWTTLYARAMANHLFAMAHPLPENTGTQLDRKMWLQTDIEAELGGTYLLDIQSEENGTWFERMSSSRTRAASAHARARAIATEPIVPIEEENWFVQRLGWNNRDATLADRALLAFLKDYAPGFVQGLTLASKPDHSAAEMAFS